MNPSMTTVHIIGSIYVVGCIMIVILFFEVDSEMAAVLCCTALAVPTGFTASCQ
jgi:hypothetical protein